jgi:hypothetical protein
MDSVLVGVVVSGVGAVVAMNAAERTLQGACIVFLSVVLSACSITSRPAAPEGMKCVEARDVVLKPNGETKVVCSR